MIEIIQQTEKNAESKLPRNIRQIGNPEKDFRIYMEDYVYTYLHPTQIHAMGGMPYEIGEFPPRLLVLVGEINHFSNRSCAFICGAVQVENNAFSEELPELNEDTWRRVHKELQQYFGKSEVVGWVLDIPGNELEVTKEMEEVHRENFISPYQFFFLMDSKEREEAFYIWKGGHLARKEGYFIYYEKNPGMQEYMISKREALCGQESPSEHIEDRAAKHYRAMMRSKKEQEYKRGTSILSYLSSLLMVAALCTASVMLMGNIRRMEHMERTISVMSIAMESTEKNDEKKEVAVETINGNVFPLEDPAIENTGPDEVQQAIRPKEEAAAALGQFEEKPKEEEAPPKGKEDTKAMESEVGETDTEVQTPPEVKEDTEAQMPPEGKDNTGAEAPPEGEGDAAQAEEPSYQSQGYYIVQPGDSLRGICYKIYENYTMINALCEINAIEDQDYIYVGQKIVLP